MKEYRKIARTKFLYEIAKDGTIRNIKSKKIMKPNTLLQNSYPRINLTTRFGSRELQKQTTFSYSSFSYGNMAAPRRHASFRSTP